jgi:proteasome lid subunit RPN8/RPN11
LSGNEIIFGDVTVREPERLTRPDRDKRFACMAYEVPGPADLPIFIDLRTADAIERHALSDTTVELGGILLGKECLDPATGQPFVWVNRALEAKHYANTQASFTYTHDSWEEITRDRDRLYPEYDIVGWYHTHPSFGIFLSSHDIFIHQHFFGQPLQVAYVVDPINQTRGFFQWLDGGLAQVGGYFLTADRNDRIALARLINDLENLPNPEGSGGGAISPRLEAELIKMLSRPAYRDVTSPAERVQTAAIFGMLGAFVGVLLVAAALWLLHLHARIQEQNESLQKLSHSIEQSAAGQRVAVDTVLEKIGGTDPAEFVARYDKAVKARDEAIDQLSTQRGVTEREAHRAKQLQSDVTSLKEELEDSKKRIAKYEKDGHDAPILRERLNTLQADYNKQKADLDELTPWLASDDGKKALEIQSALSLTRNVAFAGWGCSALLGLALAAAFLFYRPVTEPESTPPEDTDRPTHQIL